jgi:hypothetical protein
MHSTTKRLILKVAIIVFAFAVCIGATAIHAWHMRTNESLPGAAGGTFIPTSTTTLW